ncbi:hypothetical protein ILP86_04510 [Microbacterium sp. R1]|uniref:ArsR family transcriptional regulator n=1 Tax=Microbacterium phage vB_MoxS-R1 TaxID=2848881 RepID=A0A8F2E4Y3_9CAUD|nr:hypothetical protein [Microbacterium sp. R1]YP_010649885.1 ArsR family transcriptional regulator [Microbacterium phage vB_MoxS-R1]MBE7953582.1 hypothetical protein [Microbacterium sp. R1]QWT28855.1 ArsR family transcriptional regulator [Microbacterium phage vB_MoxS-R1]
MSSVDIAIMSEADALRITERIRYTAMSVRDGVDKLQRLVAEAQDGKAHVALGYASWTAYLADVMGEEPLRLARGDRREVVQWLSGQGMTTRAIASVTGASKNTVTSDLRQVSQIGTPDAPPRVPVRSAEDIQREMITAGTLDPETGEILPLHVDAVRDALGDEIADGYQRFAEQFESATPKPHARTGLDGKTYSKAAPSAPRRKPLTDSARNVGWDLRKIAQRLQNIREDDRFSRNKEEVAGLIRGHLMFTVEVCQDLLDEINQEES